MHNYVSITQIDEIRFNSCEGCESHCCDGSRFHFTPLILDDFIDVYKHFPIVFGFIGDELRALMRLSSSDTGCSHFKDNRCAIYEERPPACKLYPITPYFEDILVDTSCHGVGKEGTVLASNSSIANSFYHQRLENFEQKRQRSVAFLKEIENHLEPLTLYQGVQMYRCALYRDCDDSMKPYLKYHQDSLTHL